MTIITVDENGQQFVTPDELDEFEYYRDNIFVRTYNELLTVNPAEIIDWTSYLSPDYWESDDEDQISWDGEKWVMNQIGYGQLNAIGSWMTDLRDPFVKALGIPEDTYVLRSVSYDLIYSLTPTDGTNYCIQWFYNEDIATIRFGYINSLPFSVSEIAIGTLEILGESVIEPSLPNIPERMLPGAIDLDSNGKIHWITKISGETDDYFTNVTGSWVKTDMSFISAGNLMHLIIDSNDDIQVIYKAGANFYHVYYDGSWSSPSLISAGGAYINYMWDMWIDENDTIHLAFTDSNALRYWYKTTGGSWVNDDPGVSVSGYGVMSLCAKNSIIYIIYKYAGDAQIIIKDGSWGSENTFITNNVIKGALYIDNIDDLIFISQDFYNFYIYKETGSGWNLEYTIDLSDELGPIESLTTFKSLQSNGIIYIFVAYAPQGCGEGVSIPGLITYQNNSYTFELLRDGYKYGGSNRSIKDQCLSVLNKVPNILTETYFLIP